MAKELSKEIRERMTPKLSEAEPLTLPWLIWRFGGCSWTLEQMAEEAECTVEELREVMREYHVDAALVRAAMAPGPAYQYRVGPDEMQRPLG